MNTTGLIRQAFYYTRPDNHEKEEYFQQTIDVKRRQLATEGVKLAKLRGGHILQTAEHPEWEEEEEEGIAIEAKRVQHPETKSSGNDDPSSTEEDITPLQLEQLTVGKHDLAEKIERATMPAQVLLLYFLGRIHSHRDIILYSGSVIIIIGLWNAFQQCE